MDGRSQSIGGARFSGLKEDRMFCGSHSGLEGPARMPGVIPSGKFEGVAIAAIDTSELRLLASRFFNRDDGTRRAILRELDSRRPRSRMAHRNRAGK